MGWKKLFVGEKMPDKNDPKYKQRYESEVNAGRKFARMMKLDVLAGMVQNFANNHRKLFLVIYKVQTNQYSKSSVDNTLFKEKEDCLLRTTCQFGDGCNNFAEKSSLNHK